MLPPSTGMEAARSSEMSVSCYNTKRHKNPEYL